MTTAVGITNMLDVYVVAMEILGLVVLPVLAVRFHVVPETDAPLTEWALWLSLLLVGSILFPLVIPVAVLLGILFSLAYAVRWLFSAACRGKANVPDGYLVPRLWFRNEDDARAYIEKPYMKVNT